MGRPKNGSAQRAEREETKMEKMRASGTIGRICQELERKKENGNRKELEKALCALKELEKEQRQEEYEKQVVQGIEKLLGFTVEAEQEAMKQKIETFIDRLQNMAFMEGYRYAIAVLEESLVHME